MQNKAVSYMKGFIPYAFAAFLIGIVGGFVTVLGPAFVQDMNLDYNNTTWTALALTVSSAVFAPVLGKIADMLGRRTTLLLGIGIFALGNIMTALAASLVFMIFSRIIVGIGTAAVAPTILSYIVTEFPAHAVAKGFSLYMLISSSAVIFGPSLGGLILETWNWRILMWICVILSLLFFLLCWFTHPKTDTTPKQTTPFDVPGAVFVILFFSFLLCIPSFGQNFGWQSPALFLVLFLALITGVGLVLSEKRALTPILSGKFMLRKSFLLPVIVLFLTQGLMQANMTNLIVFVNYTQPANSVISGYAISIMYVGMSLGSILLGPLAGRLEPKRVLTGSLFLTAVGCGIMLLFSANTSLLLLALALGILGFGLGGNATIFLKIVLSNVPAHAAGTGTGTYGLFRDLAAPFGVAVFVPLFTNRITQEASQNITLETSAVNAIHSLALIELACIVTGILIIQFLPRIYHKDSQ